MGGKTGTAQVRRISKKERETRVLKNNELPWKERDHALFVGFAPVDSPRYAISVVVEHGGGGSKVAAPIARDILELVQRRNIEWISKNQTTEKSAVQNAIISTAKDDNGQEQLEHGE
jgi:cell division protein FtsI/penicillin-binding protein 2